MLGLGAGCVVEEEELSHRLQTWSQLLLLPPAPSGYVVSGQISLLLSISYL